jgi:hypothetical protein
VLGGSVEKPFGEDDMNRDVKKKKKKKRSQ